MSCKSRGEKGGERGRKGEGGIIRGERERIEGGTGGHVVYSGNHRVCLVLDELQSLHRFVFSYMYATYFFFF